MTSTLPTFTDATGKTWHLHLSKSVAKEVRQRTGLTLDPFDGHAMQQLGRLVQRLPQWVGLLWVLVERDAKQRVILRPEFFDAMQDADAIRDSLTAFLDALGLFVRTSSERQCVNIGKALWRKELATNGRK